MSTSILSASLFVGGVAVGATGALLLGSRRPVAVAPPPQTATPAPSIASPTATAYTDGRLIGGHPGPVADFLRHAAYVSAYDRAKKHPHWTAEHITAATIRPPPPPIGDAPPARGDRSRSVFKEDERVPSLFRSTNADYFRSGYDRGHMVPAADAKSSQLAMDETFLLSNIAPQVGEGFNRDYWAHTEDFVRRLTQRFADVYVFTIPLYLPRQSAADGKWRVTYEVIGNPPNVHVPTHFAKVIYALGQPTATGTAAGARSSLGGIGASARAYGALGAFVMPNAIIPNQAPLTSFAVPVEAVERAAGLQLFPPAIKTNAKALCDTVDCQIVVRDFSNRNQAPQQIKAP